MGKIVLITNADIYLPDRCLTGGAILVEDGRIARIYEPGESLPEMEGTAAEIVESRYDAGGRKVVPGFIDLHVHGGGGADAMEAGNDPSEIDRMARYHAAHGTTSFLPTTVTASHEQLLEVTRGIKRAMATGTGGAEVLGIHLEGPYLNPKRCGAQDPRSMRLPSHQEYAELLQEAGGVLKLVTLAPEVGDNMQLIPYLCANGVTVSIGHSGADAETVSKAVAAGATHVTHLFNGMSPLHHREPGVAGAALIHDELAVELICDGLHLHPQVVKMVYNAKLHDRIVLVTDSISAAGCPNGEYHLGGLPIIVQDGKATLLDGGNLAGSCLTMDRSLANTLAYTGRSLSEILPGLTINPARQIKVDDRKGSIEPGKDADLVILDTDCQVVRTYVKGACVYER